MAIVDELRTIATWDGAGLDKGLKGAAANLTRFQMGAIAAGAAAAGVLALLVSSAKEAGDEFAVMQRAANNFHGSFPTAEMEEFTGQMQELTAVADDQVAEFLGLLGAYGLTAQQARNFAPGILDAAEALKAQGVSTESLSRQIGMAVQSGNLGRLGRLLKIDEAKFAVDRVGALQDALRKFEGSAAAFGETMPGSIAKMNNALADARGALGKGLIGPITTIAGAIAKAANAFAKLPEPVRNVATVALVLAVPALVALSVRLRILELQYLKTAAAAAKQGAASTAAATQTATAAATTGKAALAFGARLGVFGALAAAAGFAAQEAFKAAGAKQENLDKRNPTALGAKGGDWLAQRLGAKPGEGLIGLMQRKMGGGEAGAKPKSEQEKANELLAKIAENTDPSKAVGSREAEAALGRGRVARALADTLGGRA